METKIVHIKSPNGIFCTKVLANVKGNKIVKIIKWIDTSIGCNEEKK